MGKRTVAISVKMSEEDYESLRKAADSLWPGAVITNSGMVLGLAKIGAEQATVRKPKKKRR